MRRIAWCALIAVLMVGAAAPGAAEAASGRRIEVDGAVRGVTDVSVGCKTMMVAGTGTFHAPDLGRGTYSYRVCATNDGPNVPIVGTITLTPTHGGTITGTINTTYHPPGSVTFPVVVTGGTQRFVHARGTLSLGPIVESHPTNCDENVCRTWKEAGPITGTITHLA